MQTDKDRPNTLKIFMAPEFYFRPKDSVPERSYTETEMKALLAVLKHVFTQDKFDNWLCILGTIIWYQAASNILDAADLSDKLEAHDDLEAAKEKPIVWNTLVIAGKYSNDNNAGLRTFSKLNYADVDKIQFEYQPVANKLNQGQTLFDTLGKKNAETIRGYLEKTQKERWPDCFIKVGVNNLWFGVEICLDHSMRVLKNAFPVFKQAKNVEIDSLDFQVLTACGMRIQPLMLVIKQNRFILRMDGATELSEAWRKPFHFSEIQKYLGTVTDGNNKKLRNRITTAYVDDFKEPYDSTEAWKELNKGQETLLTDALKLEPGDLEGYYFEGPQNQGVQKKVKVADFYKQQIVIYAPLDFTHVQPYQDNQQ